MNFKNILLIFTLLIIVCVSVSAVSATDINDTNSVTDSNVSMNNVVTFDSNGDLEKLVLDNLLLSDSDKKKINISEDRDTSFNQLNSDIDDAVTHKGILNLTHNYVYDLNKDVSYQNGINITNNLTINGNNFFINGSNFARAFYINNGVSLIINNLTITNCNSSYSGAIYNVGDMTLTNVKFSNTISKYWGSAIGNRGTIVIKSTTFVNTTTISCSDGGAVWNAGNISIENTNFTNSICTDHGGAIYNVGNMTLTNIKFNNLSSISGGGGGAIFSNHNCTIFNCTFVDCSSSNSGGAILNYGICSISDCSFVNCSATKGGVIYNWKNCTISSCTFEDYSPKSNNNVIYSDRGSLNVINSIFYNRVNGNIIIYISDSVNYTLDGNYWSMNCTTTKEFTDNKLIYVNNSYIAPDNWVLMSINCPKTIISGKAQVKSIIVPFL